MICTGLSLGLGENCVAFAKFNLVVRLEVMELPSDEFVVIRVLVRRDKTASPIGVNAKSFKVFHAQRREEFQPVA